MAAAYSARSRGVTAYRTTKGLFFISTLLCLICFTDSLIDKDQLETFKKNYQNLKQNLDNLKVSVNVPHIYRKLSQRNFMMEVIKAKQKLEMAMFSGMTNVYMTLMDQMIDNTKKMKNFLPEDFPPVDTFMDSIKAFTLKNIAQIERQNEELDEKMKDSEEELDRLKKLIDFAEEQKTEL